ncbi:MFS transporter [Thermoproteus uzoniensis]|uniref:MFS transporter n=1 Tax=Thermoproteus uzoniensis TaxID=184117 RepID=UPI001F1B0C06|nr:MFS transporter [Thermoproteus uzoniensis]
MAFDISGSGERYDVRYAWRAAPILGSVALVVMYTEAMLVPSLPKIQEEFNVTPAEASWILTIYLIVGTISAALFGSLGDIFGKKRMLVLVLSIYSVAVTFTGYAPTFPLLLLARALQGLGMAMFPLAFSLIREEFPPEMVPTAQGIVSAMFGVGIIVALPLGAYISQTFGWRATYHTVTPLAVLMTVLIGTYIRESRYRTPRRIDYLGIGLFALAASSLLVAVSEAPNWGWASGQTLSLFALAAASGAAFAAQEMTAEEPFIPRDILNRNVAAATVAILMVAYAFQMSSQNLSYLFEMPPPYGYGMTILQTGLYITPMAVVQIIGAPIAGRLLWRVGAKRMSVAGVALAVAGFQLASAYAYSGVWRLIGYMSLGFLGLALLNVSLINLLTFSVPRNRLGAATGLNTVFRNFGSAIAPAVAGTVLTTFATTAYYSLGGFTAFFTVPSRIAYSMNFDIATAMFLLSLIPIALAREVFTGAPNPRGPAPIKPPKAPIVEASAPRHAEAATGGAAAGRPST